MFQISTSTNGPRFGGSQAKEAGCVKYGALMFSTIQHSNFIEDHLIQTCDEGVNFLLIHLNTDLEGIPLDHCHGVTTPGSSSDI